LLRRIDHGLYVRAASAPEQSARTAIVTPAPVSLGQAADIVLIGCVRTKLPTPAPATELFASPLFVRRRRYAISSGRPWHILSAKFALLHPDDVIGPYDVYLADQDRGYRQAWGEFVTAQLHQRQGDVRGRNIEIHAGETYVAPLRQPLAARGATITTPLAHLGQGEQLAWYSTTPAGQRAPLV
jgi:hypothetical protein